MTISEWFHQLFNFVSIIRKLQAENLTLMERITDLQKKHDDFDAATQTLADALVYITTPPPVEKEIELKPLRLQRRSYREEQIHWERQMSARFREQDAAQQRKDQAATR